MSPAGTRPGLSPERPFPGLRPYRFDDHEYFFGRKEQIFALYRLFDHSRFIAVVGSSGSGKSSLVRAGFLPLLAKESEEPTGRIWKMVQMHPGDTPIGNLAAAMAAEFFPKDDADVASARSERLRFALRRSSFGMSDVLRDIDRLDNTSIVLVVDQFEELFRYAVRRQDIDNEKQALLREEATHFVQILLAASRDRALNVYVLLTMRSDFIGDCASFRGLPEAVNASQFLVPSLSRDQSEQAIRGPIEQIAQATIDAELVELLLNDAGDQLDQLPVLQHCLARMWERATAGTAPDGIRPHLTMQHYRDVGEIAHALSWHADEVLSGLAGSEPVEQMFRSLAEIDTQGRIVRRGRKFKELVDETGIARDKMLTVVDRFRDEDCSFLTPSQSEGDIGDDTPIDVGHEALLRCWERVSGDPRTGSKYTGWLREEVLDGRTYRGLLVMAENKSTIGPEAVERQWAWWDRRPPRTAAWAERYGGQIEEVKRLFRDSLAALEAEQQRVQRQAELDREQERRRIEEAEERKRMQLEAANAHEREAAALRFARLARWAIAGVSLLLVVAIGLGVVAFRQSSVAQQAADSATNNLEQATGNLKQALSFSGPFASVATQIQDLLDRGTISVDAAKALFIDNSKNIPQFAATSEPVLLENWFAYSLAAADIYLALQDHQNEMKFAQQALSIAKQLIQIDPKNSNYQFYLYEASYNCGDAEDFVSGQDAKQATMQYYQDALKTATDQAQTDSAHTADWSDRETFVMNKIGDTYLEFSPPNSTQALAEYNAALKINQQIVEDPTNANNANYSTFLRDLAITMNRIGAQEALSKPSESDALKQYNDALSAWQKLLASDQSNASYQSNLASTYDNIAGILLSQDPKDFANATKDYQAALKLKQQLTEGDPTNPSWKTSLASQYTAIGDMLMAEPQPDFAGAVSDYTQSATIIAALVASDPHKKTWTTSLTDAEKKLAAALTAELPQLQQVSVANPDNASDQQNLIANYLTMAGVYIQQGNSQGAATQYQNALSVTQAFLAKNPGSTALAAETQTINEKIASLPKQP
jgi:hypothetical protein